MFDLEESIRNLCSTFNTNDEQFEKIYKICKLMVPSEEDRLHNPIWENIMVTFIITTVNTVIMNDFLRK